MEVFTDYMVQLRNEKIYSKTVMQCTDYIHRRLSNYVRVLNIMDVLCNNARNYII